MQISHNIFLCTTEYHLLLSVHIVSSLYESSEYKNLILMTTGMRKDVCKYNKSLLTNSEVLEIDWYDLRKYEIIDCLKKKRCEKFFYYQADFPVHRYLVRIFSNKGAKIILVQDGLKPYVPRKYSNLRNVLSTIKNNVLEQIYIKDYSGIFMFYNMFKYVNDGGINEIWLTHPDAFKEKIKKKQCIYKIPGFSHHSVQRLSSFFNYKLDINIEPNSILYLTQPYLSEECKQAEINFLKEIIFKYPEKKMYIKFHPSRDMDKTFYINQLPQVFFLKNINYPAELIIQNLNRVIIMSVYSNAFLMENYSCRFYYIFPILKGFSNFKTQQISNLANHINVITSVEQIEFYDLL